MPRGDGFTDILGSGFQMPDQLGLLGRRGGGSGFGDGFILPTGGGSPRGGRNSLTGGFTMNPPGVPAPPANLMELSGELGDLDLLDIFSQGDVLEQEALDALNPLISQFGTIPLAQHFANLSIDDPSGLHAIARLLAIQLPDFSRALMSSNPLFRAQLADPEDIRRERRRRDLLERDTERDRIRREERRDQRRRGRLLDDFTLWD